MKRVEEQSTLFASSFLYYYLLSTKEKTTSRKQFSPWSSCIHGSFTRKRLSCSSHYEIQEHLLWEYFRRRYTKSVITVLCQSIIRVRVKNLGMCLMHVFKISTSLNLDLGQNHCSFYYKLGSIQRPIGFNRSGIDAFFRSNDVSLNSYHQAWFSSFYLSLNR